MSHTSIDLQFADVLGRAHHAHVLTTDGRGWHVHASLEGRSFDKDCGSWERVERTLNWLRRHAHEPNPNAAASSWSRVARVAGVAMLVCAAATADAQPLADPPTITFIKATRDYALMHRRIEQQLPPTQMTDRPETIARAIGLMAAAVRAERAGARQGDFFTPALARELRARIARALDAHGLGAADVLEAGRTEAADRSAFTLRVNGTFPWVLGVAMLPCVVEALPPLPQELQYRIVGFDLVLVDVHAGLIVDILPNAVVDLTLQE